MGLGTGQKTAKVDGLIVKPWFTLKNGSQKRTWNRHLHHKNGSLNWTTKCLSGQINTTLHCPLQWSSGSLNTQVAILYEGCKCVRATVCTNGFPQGPASWVGMMASIVCLDNVTTIYITTAIYRGLGGGNGHRREWVAGWGVMEINCSSRVPSGDIIILEKWIKNWVSKFKLNL